MRWMTTIWMSAALAVTTAALSLTVEGNLNSPGQKDLVQDENRTSSGSHESYISGDINSDETEAASNENTATYSKELIAKKSAEIPLISIERETVKVYSTSSDLVSDNTPTSKPETTSVTDSETTVEHDITGSTAPPDGEPSTGDDNDAVEPDLPVTEEPEYEVDSDDTILNTTSGLVRGYRWRNNADIISYIDIRYGTFNRFQAPEPISWAETIHGVKDHNKRCPQLEDKQYVGDLDCLTLSIFKPSDAVDASVLVHIHDGNFMSGSANPAIYGPEYLTSKGVILVLPNYRLGALGFLCLQNDIAPGNAALKDLTLAINWVKENIATFGGDPDNISVSGVGSAAALAGYLALSPMSRYTISKVITDSGSVLSHWAFDRNPTTTASNLQSSISDFSSWEKLEIADLINVTNDISLCPCLDWGKTPDDRFMATTPWTTLKDQNINITFMIGSANYAGGQEYAAQTNDSIKLLNDDAGRLLPNDLRFQSNTEKANTGNKVKQQYFGETAIAISDVDEISQYFTDASYLGPGLRTARALVNAGATVYFYEFAYVGDLNRELVALQQLVDGAVRGDIIGYLFTQDGSIPAEETTDSFMVTTLVELWTTFLKNGKPATDKITWSKLEKTTNSEEQWLSISNDTSLKKGVHVERLALWTELYDQHYIEHNLAAHQGSSVYTVFALQCIFFICFFRHGFHFF